MLTVAVICMFSALGFYTYAVFNGRKRGLGLHHLLAFGAGLAFDYYGTYLMGLLIASYGNPPGIHEITGHYSLWGMAFHFFLALMASVFKGFSFVDLVFHRVSVIIYALWVVAFITGAFFGMLAVTV